MSNTQRSSGSLESFEMIASTSWVTAPVRSHSVAQLLRQCRARTVPGYSRFTCFRILRATMMSDATVVKRDVGAPVKVVLQCEILRDEHGLPVLLYHVEVIRRIDTSLKQDSESEPLSFGVQRASR